MKEEALLGHTIIGMLLLDYSAFWPSPPQRSHLPSSFVSFVAEYKPVQILSDHCRFLWGPFFGALLHITPLWEASNPLESPACKSVLTVLWQVPGHSPVAPNNLSGQLWGLCSSLMILLSPLPCGSRPSPIPPESSCFLCVHTCLSSTAPSCCRRVWEFFSWRQILSQTYGYSSRI